MSEGSEDSRPLSGGAEGETNSVGEDQGLEGRLNRLEEIVTALDSDGIELENALKLFEEGVGHVRLADELLSRAELKVEELLGAHGAEKREFPTEGEGGGVSS